MEQEDTDIIVEVYRMLDQKTVLHLTFETHLHHMMTFPLAFIETSTTAPMEERRNILVRLFDVDGKMVKEINCITTPYFKYHQKIVEIVENVRHNIEIYAPEWLKPEHRATSGAMSREGK